MQRGRKQAMHIFQVCIINVNKTLKDKGAFFGGGGEIGKLICDLSHMDSSTPEKPKIRKRIIFCYEKTGWRHAIFMSGRFFSSPALEFD